MRFGLAGLLVVVHVAGALALIPSRSNAQASTTAPVAKVAPAKPASGSNAAKSGWAELSAAQQSALQPLAPTWGSISAGQKRKWIALSSNFQNLSNTERATLHGRMTEWVNLSPVQRSQARLNFAQTNQLSNDEKKAQWEAYQALSAEQKQQLGSGGQLLPGGAAPALKPVDPKKLAAVPMTRSDPVSAARASTAKPRPLRDSAPAQRSAKPTSAPASTP